MRMQYKPAPIAVNAPTTTPPCSAAVIDARRDPETRTGPVPATAKNTVPERKPQMLPQKTPGLLQYFMRSRALYTATTALSSGIVISNSLVAGGYAHGYRAFTANLHGFDQLLDADPSV